MRFRKHANHWSLHLQLLLAPRCSILHPSRRSILPSNPLRLSQCYIHLWRVIVCHIFHFTRWVNKCDSLSVGFPSTFEFCKEPTDFFLALCLWQQLEIDDGQIGCGDKTSKWVHSNLVWLAIKGDEYEIHPLATLGLGPFMYCKTQSEDSTSLGLLNIHQHLEPHHWKIVYLNIPFIKFILKEKTQ